MAVTLINDTTTAPVNVVSNEPSPRTKPNKTILQAFEWYTTSPTPSIQLDPKTGVLRDVVSSHWLTLTALLPDLRSLGITSLWIPPACKSTHLHDNGYGIYDLYDLGEFNAKGSISTKWGTKAELQALCLRARELGMGIIFDAVLNHRAAADGSEDCEAVCVDPKNRNKEIHGSHRNIEAWTKFNYDARDSRYSALKYNKSHFSGVDWDSRSHSKGIFKIVETRPDGTRKNWADDVATGENGNYDYLMFADVDFGNAEVQEDVKNWGTWLVDTLPGVRGIRLDAIKHYSASFQRAFIEHVTKHADKSSEDEFFFVGEYWLSNSKFLSRHIDRTFGGNIHLFDVKLVYNLSDISSGRQRDLRSVFRGTLVQLQPKKAITFVSNHDTQKGQSLAAPVEDWFIPHAYALILLRQGGHPCVFWGDVFGTEGPHARIPNSGGRLSRIVRAREAFAYGEQVDCISKNTNKDSSCIAWSRKWKEISGDSLGMVVVLSTSWSWKKSTMFVGEDCAGQIWTDLMGWSWSAVQIDENGWGTFPVGPRSMGVWTWKDTETRKGIDELVYPPELPVEDTMVDPTEEEDVSQIVVENGNARRKSRSGSL